MFTLNRSLRPSRRQQSHSPNHKILKCLVRRLAPFAHILGETRYLRRRVLIAIFEGGFELGCLFDFPRVTFEDIGFAAPLLGGSGDWGEYGGREVMPWAAETQQGAAGCRNWWHCVESGESGLNGGFEGCSGGNRIRR